MTRNPDVQDTLDGIVQWWLLESRIRIETRRVREALDELVERGLVVRVASAGRPRYRLGSAYRDRIRSPGTGTGES